MNEKAPGWCAPGPSLFLARADLRFAALDGRMHVQATVDGDEMSGAGVGPQNFGQFNLKLSRRR